MQIKQLFVLCIILIPSSPLSPINGIENEESGIKAFNDDSINILSYNMWGLPVWLPKVGLNNRFQNAVDDLATKPFDIIFLQECFSKRLRRKVISKLDKAYYTSLDYSCNEKFMLGLTKDCYGGLMTFSKLPIIEEVFHPYPIYSDMKKTEKIGQKGFVLTKVINQENDTINLINTHLYAGPNKEDENYRFLQITYMDSILRSDGIYRQACILGGDLNICHPSISERKSTSYSEVYKFITETMQFEDSAPELNEDDYTIDANRNYYCSSNNGKQKLDYIMIYHPAKSSNWSIEKAQSQYAHSKSFSDHLAWQVTYNYN